MKKLYIDIRFAKCILALTAGWLMAGCSADDELGNGSAAQQLSMTPMVNDLQQTRVKEEENLNEKNLLSLDFKMFEEPTSSELRIDRQFNTPVENKAEELGSGNWKSALHLDVDNTYPYYAVANAKGKDNLKGKNLAELLACTQQDEDIWKPATMVSDKKFLMSSQGEYKITQDPEQNIPVELVRAAAKIKLNISSTVKDYKIKEVKWKFINYNTNTAIFARQPATPIIITDNQEYKAAAEKDGNGNDIYKVTTYSYSTTWTEKDDMPQFVADVIFESADAKTTITKHLVIPVRDPQGEKKLDRNYIYTVNAVIKYLDTNTDIDYDGDTDYLKWEIAKWTQGEDTFVKGDKASFLVVYPTQLNLKALTDWNKENWCIDWFASSNCNTDNNRQAYYFDKYGYKKEDQNLVGQTISQVNTSTGDNNRGRITIHGSKPEQNTILYINFLVKTNDGIKSQKVNVRKYPAIYSLNVANADASDKSNTQNRLYTVQFTTNQGINDFTVAKPKLDSENMSTDKTVSPAFIIASTGNSNETAESNEAARRYCQNYSERATTYKNEPLEMTGWRLPTRDEVNQIYQLAKQDKAIDSQVLKGENYWTLDGDKTTYNNNQPAKGTYVRCVHDLTLEEIEKIENQGIE